MQLAAKITQILPHQNGAGKNGPWKKQHIILETEGQFPKKVFVSIWGDKIDNSQLQIGNNLIIDFDLESREYNGRWYTDVKARKIDVLTQDTLTNNPKISHATSTNDYNDTDLPF